MSQIKYLGHVISEDIVRPDPDKINVVLKYPVPETPKQIKAFLGLIGHYRHFIPNFAVIAEPLNNLLRKDVPFNWDKEHTNAFEKLKKLRTDESILEYLDFTREFILTTDASKIAVGAILSQGDIGQDKPIAFAS